jgi:hypothetical protein
MLLLYTVKHITLKLHNFYNHTNISRTTRPPSVRSLRRNEMLRLLTIQNLKKIPRMALYSYSASCKVKKKQSYPFKRSWRNMNLRRWREIRDVSAHLGIAVRGVQRPMGWIQIVYVPVCQHTSQLAANTSTGTYSVSTQRQQEATSAKDQSIKATYKPMCVNK